MSDEFTWINMTAIGDLVETERNERTGQVRWRLQTFPIRQSRLHAPPAGYRSEWTYGPIPDRLRPAWDTL